MMVKFQRIEPFVSLAEMVAREAGPRVIQPPVTALFRCEPGGDLRDISENWI